MAFKSSCDIDTVNKDDQICGMKFGSWTHNGSKLNLQLNGDAADTNTFVANNDWSLEGKFETSNIL